MDVAPVAGGWGPMELENFEDLESNYISCGIIIQDLLYDHKKLSKLDLSSNRLTDKFILAEHTTIRTS